MTMTTGVGISAAETVHTDIRPGQNITLPSGQILSEDAQILLDKSIVAKPLGVAPNEAINVRNTSFRYRWVNRLGANGSLYAKRRAQGWTLASTTEVEPLSVEITNDQGELRLGDLVLMKIPVERYQSAMKASMQKALILQRDKRYITDSSGNAPSTDVNSDAAVVVHSATETNRSQGHGKYITNYEPSQAELDAKMGPDKQGRK